MDPRRAAAFALALAAAAAVPAHALSPQAEEYLALNRQLAKADCRQDRDTMEHFVAQGTGDATRLREVQERAKAMSPEERALRERRNKLLDANNIPEADQGAVREARENLRLLCPYKNIKGGGVPRDLPPARSADEARLYLNALVPLVLAKWRMCEVFIPERKGELERGWAESRLSKLQAPEMQAMATDVRAWMKDGFTVHPQSQLAKAPASDRAITVSQFCQGAADLKRIEAALPAGFVK